MMKSYRPPDDELMREAAALLRRHAGFPSVFRKAAAHATVGVPPELARCLDRFGGYAGLGPAAFEKPRYGTPAYAIALRIAWITAEEEKADRLAWEERRRRSLQSCHRCSLHEEARHPEPKDTGAYVPELGARLENDRNLTDGARRCARKITELTYRQNREERALDVKVYYCTGPRI